MGNLEPNSLDGMQNNPVDANIISIRDHLMRVDAAILEMRIDLSRHKSRQSALEDKMKGVINFRYWLGGIVAASLITGLSIFYTVISTLEDRTIERIGVMSRKIDNNTREMSILIHDRYDKLDTKITGNLKLMLEALRSHGN